MKKETPPPSRRINVRKKAAILRAAMRLFLKNGYTKTSMDAIARQANVTKQTVYAYFDDKHRLFQAIVAALATQHAPLPNLLQDKNASVEQMLYDIGLAFLNLVSSKEGIAATQLIIAEAYRNQKLAQHYYESGPRRILLVLGDYLGRQVQAGRLHIDSPLSAASYFFAMLKGNYYLRILLNSKPKPTPKEKESHVRECVAIFLRLYGDKAPLQTKDIL